MAAHRSKFISATRKKWELLLLCAIVLVVIVGSVIAEAVREPSDGSSQYVYTPQYDSSLWGLDY